MVSNTAVPKRRLIFRARETMSHRGLGMAAVYPIFVRPVRRRWTRRCRAVADALSNDDRPKAEALGVGGRGADAGAGAAAGDE